MTYRKMTRFLFLASISFVLGLFSVSKVMADELAEPQLAIKTASVKLKQNLKDESFINDFSKINQFVKEVIEPHTDFEKIAKLVVGKYWRSATGEQKKAFVAEFKTLLVRTYSRAFIDFNEWSMEFLPLDMETAVKKAKNKKGDVIKSVMIRTKILQPGKPAFPISYKMWLVDGTWKTYDIVIEGISLVKNYRSSIGTRIKNSKSGLSEVTEFLAGKNKAALAKKQDDDDFS